MNAQISRRALVRRVAGLGALVLLSGCQAPSAPATQPTTRPTKIRRIGYVAGSARGAAESEPHFRQTLRDLGYVDGRDFDIELRTESDLARMPGLFSQLISLPADVLVVQGSPLALAAKQATTTIPVVFLRVTDPVAQGIVASLARPGANVTGVSASASLGPKQLEILVETVPGLRRVAMLSNPNNAGATLQLRDAQQAALTLGLDLQVFEVRTTDELDIALDAIARWRPDALQMGVGFGPVRDLVQIPNFAAKLRLPQIYTTDAAYVRTGGGLMALGSNQPSVARRAAQLVDKIFRGSKPGDLPVEIPTQLDFIVNLTAAQRIGLTIPASVLRQATEVVP